VAVSAPRPWPSSTADQARSGTPWSPITPSGWRCWRSNFATVDRDELRADTDVAQLAFELDALVTAANTARQLGDETKLATARAIIDRLLT